MAKEQIQKSFYWWYIGGCCVWWFLFKFLFGSICGQPSYCYSHILCILVLGLNIWLHAKKCTISSYEKEERIYEYVERNAFYLIMAVTIFLLISTQGGKSANVFENLISNNIQGSVNFPLIVYSQACSVVCCVIIIALYWMPTEDSRAHWLVHLKHAKTVILTYALSFFFIGPIEVILKIRNHF